MKKKKAISSASARLKSLLKIKGISPKGVDANSQTIAFIMTREETIDLATKMLAVAQAENADGTITVTGKKKDNTVTIIRNFT